MIIENPFFWEYMAILAGLLVWGIAAIISDSDKSWALLVMGSLIILVSVAFVDMKERTLVYSIGTTVSNDGSKVLKKYLGLKD